MHKYLKRINISKNVKWMLAIVVAATLARFILIYNNWPITNSDEGNMGLLALHVAYQGDHPTFFYGLPYMAPLEGYIAAPMFRIFGASLFTLRLGLLPFFAAFLICMYYLTRLLYSQKFALAIVILLSLGSSDIIYLQIKAVGEYPETELFAAFIPLLAAWLALSSYSPIRDEVLPSKQRRFIVYGFLGVITGLALWVDFLILPIVATAGILLLLFCFRELLSWVVLCLLLGGIVGAFPLILYNLNAPWDQNSWSTLLKIHQSGAKEIVAQHLTWLHHIVGTLMIGLPSVTGANPACPVTAFPPFSSPTVSTLPCIVFYGVWGVGYLILWFIATIAVVRMIWQLRRHFFKQNDALEERQVLILQCSRLMLSGSVVLTLVSYATGTSSAVPPVVTYRYLLFALIAAPAILWPLWNGLRLLKTPTLRKINIPLLLSGGVLLIIFTTFFIGTVRTLTEIPGSQAAYQQEDALVGDLLQIGATRIYADYWTCNRLTFHSQEKIICSALDDQLNPGFDRYLPYRFIVRKAAHPAYIFPTGSKQADVLKHELQISSTPFQVHTFEGYLVYQVT